MELAELVKACQRRDSRAQAVLYDRYKSKLLGVCLRYAKTLAEAEDIFRKEYCEFLQKSLTFKILNRSIAGSRLSWCVRRSITIIK